MNLTSEEPAIDSGLKAVSLLERHSLLTRDITPAASFEGSILLCNDYRHASAPARSESWGVVDVQVDFTCRRQLAATTDRRCERQLEFAISRAAAAIATPFLRFRPTQVRWIQHASSRRSLSRLFRRSLVGGQSINQVQNKST